jgi:ribosomal protein S26
MNINNKTIVLDVIDTQKVYERLQVEVEIRYTTVAIFLHFCVKCAISTFVFPNREAFNWRLWRGWCSHTVKKYI